MLKLIYSQHATHNEPFAARRQTILKKRECRMSLKHLIQLVGDVVRSFFSWLTFCMISYPRASKLPTKIWVGASVVLSYDKIIWILIRDSPLWRNIEQISYDSNPDSLVVSLKNKITRGKAELFLLHECIWVQRAVNGKWFESDTDDQVLDSQRTENNASASKASNSKVSQSKISVHQDKTDLYMAIGSSKGSAIDWYWSVHDRSFGRRYFSYVDVRLQNHMITNSSARF